ncbi:MAG: transcription elongation factor GreA [Bdellovibrionales bacterium]|nr:transcription elongation factor GreA [Bdellovibrionales bacterium]
MSGQDRQPMTAQGKLKLETELRQLIHVERPSIIKAIEEARSNGDLSENADYDAAKERQAFCEARINDIQSKIANSEVIDIANLKSDRIIFGAHIVLCDLETEEEINYQIVGEDEADVKSGRISVFSPLARAVIGKKIGDIVEFKSPKGEKEYEVRKFFFR